MPKFIRRVRRSLRRSRQTSFAENHSPSLDLDDNEDYFVTHEADRRTRIRSRPRTPAPLPVIMDRGPPTRNRYADADVFWNSIMVEAHPPSQSRPQIRGRTKSEVNNRNATNEAAATSSIRPTLGSSRTEVDSGRRIRRRRGLKQLERGISYGRERAENDLDVFSYHRVDYDSPYMLDNERSESPLSPGTKAYDDFMDFPFYQSVTEKANGTGQTTTIGIAITTSEDQRLVLDAPASNSGRSRTVTWDSCLHDISNNGNRDPEMRQAILDRAHAVNTMKIGTNTIFPHISLAEAGLVPNFNRPVVASGFYHRVGAQEDPPASMRDSPDYFSHCHTNSDLYEDKSKPPATNGTTNFAVTSHSQQLPNGVSVSTRSIASSSSSSSSKTIRPTHLPTLYHTLENDLDNLLSSHLSPDHLSLLHNTLQPPLNGTPSSPPRPSLIDPSSLIRALHVIVLGLSDRIHQTEEVLVPSLSTTLERKTKAIDLLLGDIKALDEHIDLLSKTLNFGNNVLEGCWARTFENLRTLGEIKKRRDVGRWDWFGRRRGGEMGRNGNKSNRRGETYVQDQRDGRQSVDGQDLSKSEMAAMILMTKQNVNILAEDIEDMMAMVEICHGERPILKGVKVARESNGEEEDVRDV